MARPSKHNLHYFPLDVDFFEDHKVVQIEEITGLSGGYIALRLLSLIYADRGYYMEWPEGYEYTAARRFGNGITGAQVMEILQVCLKVGLFDEGIYKSQKILTSSGVQKRWEKVMNECRRKVIVNQKIWLVSSEETGVSSEETLVTSEETGVSVTFSTQKEIKGKEIKGNKNLSDEGACAPPVTENPNSDPQNPKPKRSQDAAARRKFIPPTLAEVQQYFLETVGNPKNGPAYWPEDLCRNQAAQLVDHYTSNGWKQNKNKPIVEWKSTCRNWLRRYKSGDFQPAKNEFRQPETTPPAVSKSPAIDPNAKIKRELDFLRDMEESGSDQLLNIGPEHYDFLKNAGQIKFTDEQKLSIEEKAKKYLKQNDVPAEAKTILLYMKKFGVKEYFKSIVPCT